MDLTYGGGERFTMRDGERLVMFGPGIADEAPTLLVEHGFEGFTLLTTPRHRAQAEAVTAAAATVLDVPPGRVDEIAAGLLGRLPDAPLVALGGGRVVDTAKALAGAAGHGGRRSDDPVRARCAALPTTLSGAEMTPFHRLPAGVDGARMVRPALVVADPELMASQPPTKLAGSAMNALAHAMEALYTPLANPVVEPAALRAAQLLADGIAQDPPARRELALGALLAGYASGSTGIAVHHAVCQTIVRTAGTAHAETNAVVLPHSARLMAPRAPGSLAAFARALGDPAGNPEAAAGLVARLAARCGHTRLSTLGVGEEHVEPVVAAVLRHPLLGNTPDPPGEDELRALLRAAL